MSSNLPVLERRRMIPQREWVQQPNEIRYTTTNGQKIVNKSTYVPNNPLLNNVYHPEYGGILAFRDSISNIGAGFSGNTTLSSVTFIDEQNIRSIPNNAFSGCTNLVTISLPPSITSIGSSAFFNCSKLALSELPSGITSIGNDAFAYCSKLTITELPLKMTSIGTEVFYGCTGLRNLTFSSGITSIGTHAFSTCTGLVTVVLPNKLKSIGFNSFANCTNLVLTELPTGVTTLEQSAFLNCYKLAITELPASITSIGNYAFYNCTPMKNVRILNTTQKITGGVQMFERISGLKIYVPNSLLADYQADSNWSRYTLVGYDPT